jgi:hypothetical protein
MASGDLTDAQQKELDAALLAGSSIPSFGGVVVFEPKTNKWRKANAEEITAHEAEVDPVTLAAQKAMKEVPKP